MKALNLSLSPDIALSTRSLEILTFGEDTKQYLLDDTFTDSEKGNGSHLLQQHFQGSNRNII